MRAIIPAIDGSGRYLVQVDDDEVDDDPHVLYICEPFELPRRPGRLSSKPKRQP